MNTRRNLIRGSIVLLVVVFLSVAGTYLIRQNYKRHHYITGTFQYGRYRGQKYRFTEEQQDELHQKADRKTDQIIDAMNKLHESERR